MWPGLFESSIRFDSTLVGVFCFHVVIGHIVYTVFDLFLVMNFNKQIRSAIENSTSDYDKEKLQERLAKLSGGVAVLKVQLFKFTLFAIRFSHKQIFRFCHYKTNM